MAGASRWRGNIPGWTEQGIAAIPPGAVYDSHYLLEDGRLFFNSPDDLVPAAVNHKEDVYEYEPAGVGSCQSASGGCVSLISGGSSDRESAFLEATPTGSNVFFLTAAPLLPQDTDTAPDIYDARECTTQSPCLTAPAQAAEGCSSEAACRPAQPAQQLPEGPAGTAALSAPGNPSSQKPSPGKNESRAAKQTAKPLTRAQKLAKAMAACRTRYRRANRRRAACEAHARKLYGPKRRAKRTNRHTHGSARRAGR